jgi:K+-transporting ATPase ATPase B chain
MTKHSEIKLLDRALLTRAVTDSFRKLHPRRMAKNPVMFVVEAGTVLATLALLGVGTRGTFSFQLQVVLWLWATVLFANFAEAVAEGRG